MSYKDLKQKNNTGFITDLDVRVVSSKKRNYKLLSPLVYKTDIKHSLLPASGNIIVPIGFVTDFASFLLVTWGDKQATLHDYLYSLKIDRSIADEIYFEALKNDPEINYIEAVSCYLGVRAFGWTRYI